MATCQALAARGHDVTLVVRPDSRSTGTDPFEFYGLPATDRLHIRTVPAASGRVANRLRFLAAAIRLARDWKGPVYTRDLGLASVLLRWLRVRVVYESHGLAPVVSEELPRLLGKPALAPSPAKIQRLDRRERQVWAEASAYVAITRTLADELGRRYGHRDGVFVVPDGAFPIDVTPPAPTSSRPLAAYAGHLYPWKGVDVFVGALALAPGIDGLVIGGHPGEADLTRVRALAQELGVASRLEMTGLVPPAAVASRLAAAAMLVLPNTASAVSDRYTSPLKLFEYLQLGRAIVASDLAAIREVLVHEETGLLVPPGDPAALAAALQRLAADPSLAARLGAAARGRAADFTWAARAARLETALVAACA